MIMSTGLRFLAIRIEWAGVLPQQTKAVLTGLIAAARWALSLSIYGGILMGLSFAAREKVFAPFAVLFIGALSLIFVCFIGQVLKNWENVPAVVNPTQPLGGPGLIAANNALLEGTVVVLLQGPSDPGRRVVAVPEKPLLYQTEFPGREVIAQSSGPFGNSNPWFLQSLDIDLRLSAENLRQRFDAGLIPFLIYAGALIVLLTSCLFVFNLSAWPMANLFLGCLAFRGIMALETFFNSPEMQDVFESFLQSRLPVPQAVPFIFCSVGILAYFYSFLVFIAGKRDINED